MTNSDPSLNGTGLQEDELDKYKRLLTSDEVDINLRIIIAFARSNKEPKDIYVKLIRQVIKAEFVSKSEIEKAINEAYLPPSLLQKPVIYKGELLKVLGLRE